MGARIMLVSGRVQTADNVTHIVAEQLIDRTDDLHLLSEEAHGDPLKSIIAHADEVLHPISERRGPPAKAKGGHPRNVRVIPSSRDFH
jgi:error-prone DNA polymerase